MKENLVGWFEIPATDMQRAKAFYDTVFQIEISVHDFGGLLMGWFPFAEGKAGATGSLVQHEDYIPSLTHGPVIYFSCKDVADELGRVEAAGGEILRPKTKISDEHGFMALCKDSEGNRIALHSQS